METKNKFETVFNINVEDKIEKKEGLSYLSWAWAWAEFKKIYPEAKYTVKKFGDNQLPYTYDPNTGYMVFTEVEADGLIHEMWLPVMNSSNKALKAEPYVYKTKYGERTADSATMFDINKTIMRCLTKNLAMFGLGLYIYAGEDLPEEEKETKEIAAQNKVEELKKEADKCQTIEELKKFYAKHKGLGKDFDNHIALLAKKLGK